MFQWCVRHEWITKSQCILTLKRSSVCDITSCFTTSGTTHTCMAHQLKARGVENNNNIIVIIKKVYFKLWFGCRCATLSKVSSFQVLCKLPLQMRKAALLYEMLFFFVISFLKKYISFYVFKVNRSVWRLISDVKVSVGAGCCVGVLRFRFLFFLIKIFNLTFFKGEQNK